MKVFVCGHWSVCMYVSDLCGVCRDDEALCGGRRDVLLMCVIAKWFYFNDRGGIPWWNTEYGDEIYIP